MGVNDDRFRQVNRYCAAHGFAAGFPNFHEANYGQGVLYGTVLLRSGAVERRDVQRAVLGDPAIDDIPALFRAAHDYATNNGFDARSSTPRISCDRTRSNFVTWQEPSSGRRVWTMCRR